MQPTQTDGESTSTNATNAPTTSTNASTTSTEAQANGTDAPTKTDWRARVAVRVPRNGGADLESDATRRLETPSGIDRAEVVRLCGLEPALAATVAQFEVRVVTPCGVDAGTVEELLADAPGTERVETVVVV